MKPHFRSIWITAAIISMVSAQPAHSEIKLGAPMALTGSISGLVDQMSKSIAVAIKQVNAQGGVLGEPLKLVHGDTKCDEDTSVSIVRELIEDEDVAALIGPVCSGATLRQARSVSIPAGVATLSFASASPLLTDLKDNDLVFRTAVSDAYKGVKLAQNVWDQGVRKIAVSFATDAYNTGVAKVFSDAFEALGGSVVSSQAHEPDAASYRGNARALTRGADTVALFAYYGSGGTKFLDELLQSGKVNRLYGADGMVSDEVLSLLHQREFNDAHFVSAAFDEERDAYRKWLAIVEDSEVDPSSVYVANAYDAAFMLALAIEAAGSAERGDIAKGLRAISGPGGERILPGEFEKARALLAEGKKIDYDGASGPVDFDAMGDIEGVVSFSTVGKENWSVRLLE